MTFEVISITFRLLNKSFGVVVYLKLTTKHLCIEYTIHYQFF